MIFYCLIKYFIETFTLSFCPTKLAAYLVKELYPLLSYSEIVELVSKPAVSQTLKQRKRGLEKESLRIEVTSGHLAQTAHPKRLGSALTHSRITTDFAEALLEFITEPCDSIEQALQQLDNTHRYTYSQLDDEILWVASMPCILANDAAIPVAEYGVSNVAKMKTAYRVGLGNRYGRPMQTIAGIHFNFSLSDEFFETYQKELGEKQPLQQFKTERYFSLIRNFHRSAWLLIYLFGASPALCKSFLQGRDNHQLSLLGRGTLHGEYATALRMGDLGYTSSAQDSLYVCYNTLDTYIKTLHRALTSPYADFEKIGLKDSEGHLKQLSTNVLQIENEYYSPIRPKRTAKSGETPINALKERGVEYIEVRCLDLNPFEPLGTDVNSLRFVELFLMDCLLQGDHVLDLHGLKESQTNFKLAINEGRKPGLMLSRDGEPLSLKDWAKESLHRMSAIAENLEANGEQGFSEAIAVQQAKIDDADLTPSGKIIQNLKEKDESFFGFAMAHSLKAERYFKSEALDASTYKQYQDEASSSLQAQQQIEANDSLTFEDYLAQYYDQYLQVD